jgi:hypothetical protein
MSQQSESQSSLQKLAEGITFIRDNAPKIAPESENQIVVTGVVASLDRILNRLFFLAGITHSKTFEPLPPIVLGESEKVIDHKPTPDERQLYLNKVKALSDQITTLHPDGILNDYTLPEDVLVIRGVAKRAGIENYEDAELTVEFIEAIQEAIKANEADDALQAKIDAQLAEGEKEHNGKDPDTLNWSDEDILDAFGQEDHDEDSFDDADIPESEQPAAEVAERKKPGPKPKAKPE